MHIIDIIVFLLFTGGVVAFGCSFFKKKGTSEEFTSAGRSLPGWVVGMSIFATYVSSISYLGYPGKAFSGDWNAFVFSLSIPIASYFAARYFVPFYRSQDSISAYSVAIVLYSMLGGMKAVIWTEAIQGIILIGGALVCMFILLFDMPEGPAQTFSIAMEDGKFSLGSFGSSLSESTFWVCLIYGVFTNLQNYGIDQSYVQRYHTAKNEKEAKFSALFGGYLFIPVSAVFFMIGTGLYAFYKVHPGILPDGVRADYVFPFFIVNELPVGLTGLLIASIFAAGMSTIATSVTSSSTIILTDYYQRFRKHAGNRERMLVLKLSSVGVGVAGILVAFAFMSVQSALDAWWALASIFSGGMLGLFLLGYISKKARNFDAVLGVVCGVILVCWIVISPFVHANLAIVFGTLLIFLVGFLSANLLNKRRCK